MNKTLYKSATREHGKYSWLSDSSTNNKPPNMHDYSALILTGFFFLMILAVSLLLS
ncbi:MAG: hypothetical protein WEA58_04150 [Balneolaceae bacterium]